MASEWSNSWVIDSGRDAIVLVSGAGDQSTSTPVIEWQAPNPRYPALRHYEVLLHSENDTYRATRLSGTSHTVERPLRNETYDIYVRAYFVDGTKTEWRYAMGSMTVASAEPVVPTITGPGRASAETSPEFRWSDDPNAERFELWVSTQNDVTPIIHQENLVSPEFTAPGDLTPGNYRMWVRTHYPDGRRSKWTATYRFEILSDVISVTGGVGEQPFGPLTISWESRPNVVRYELYINPVGRRSTVSYRRTDLTTSTHLLATNLPAGDTYEVWVRAHFEGGSKTRWGGHGAELTIRSSIVEATPTISTTGGVLVWNSEEGADLYELWVDEMDPDNPNRRITIRAYWNRLTTTSIDLNEHLSPGNYRGWLRILDAAGNKSSWSSAVNFQI